MAVSRRARRVAGRWGVGVGEVGGGGEVMVVEAVSNKTKTKHNNKNTTKVLLFILY